MIKSLKLRVGFVLQALKLAFSKPTVSIKNTLLTIQWKDSVNFTYIRAYSNNSYLGLLLGLVVNAKRKSDTYKFCDNQKYVDFCSNALQKILVNRRKPQIKRVRKMRSDFKKVRK